MIFLKKLKIKCFRKSQIANYWPQKKRKRLTKSSVISWQYSLSIQFRLCCIVQKGHYKSLIFPLVCTQLRNISLIDNWATVKRAKDFLFHFLSLQESSCIIWTSNNPQLLSWLELFCLFRKKRFLFSWRKKKLVSKKYWGFCVDSTSIWSVRK